MISALILAAAIQPVALPPFTFVGRITDYAHIAYDAEASVEVRAKTSDGTLLAKDIAQASVYPQHGPDSLQNLTDKATGTVFMETFSTASMALWIPR